MLLLSFVLAALVIAGACSSKSKQPTNRPGTPATIAIESPAANESTGPNVTLRVRLTGGQVVARTTGKLTPTDGHVHVTLDDKLISMAYVETQDLRDLTPGPHTVRAEFVAVDHAPFKNRPIAAVIFTVRSP